MAHALAAPNGAQAAAATSAGLLDGLPPAPLPGGVAPAATTGLASAVEASGALVAGTVNPGGLATSFRFDYGPTAAYGSSTALTSAGAGLTPVAVTARLDRVDQGTTVHYRLVAVNALGTVAGLDQVVELPSLPPGGLPPSGAGPSLVGLALPQTAVVGEPTTLEVTAAEPGAAVTAVQVDFGERGGFIARSACRTSRLRGPFAPGARNRLRVPYVFRRAGAHRVEVTLRSGGCSGKQRSTSQVLHVDAAPRRSGRARAQAPDARLSAGCAGAGLVPTAANRARAARATLCLVNRIRRARRLRTLRWSAKLARAAADHNRDMSARQFLAHTGPGGPALASRLRRVRYPGGAGENIGVGSGTPYSTPRGMVEGWMASPVHRANLVERDFRALGVAILPAMPLPPQVPGATYTAELGDR